MHVGDLVTSGARASTGTVLAMLIHLPPGQNGRRFTDNILRCILVNEKFCMIKISLKFVPKGLIQ